MEIYLPEFWHNGSAVVHSSPTPTSTQRDPWEDPQYVSKSWMDCGWAEWDKFQNYTDWVVDIELEINCATGLFQDFSGIICDFPRGSNSSNSWVINIESCWEDPQNCPKDRPKDWVIDIACTSSRMDCCWGWENPRIFIMALPY